MITRRTAVAALAGTSLASAARSGAIKLEIGNYGMQNLEVDRALALIREIGYDGAELCLMPGWPSEPSRLDNAARRRIGESGFPVPSLIDTLNTMAPGGELNQIPGRIRAAAELAHDLSPNDPPILQTVLGGKVGDWDKIKETMASRVSEWARIAGDNHIRLAVKAHAMNACDTPDKLIWLLDRVNHPALTAVYDYGHFQLANLSIEDTMKALLPRSAFITVKDSKMMDGQPRFLLPGDGSIDYARYFGTAKAMKWSGWVLVEVTRQLQIEPGYQAETAARRSYRHLAPILARLGLRDSPVTRLR